MTGNKRVRRRKGWVNSETGKAMKRRKGERRMDMSWRERGKEKKGELNGRRMEGRKRQDARDRRRGEEREERTGD